MMQEYVDDKTVALSIKAIKITGNLLAKAMRDFLKKAREPTHKHGKQSVKTLTKQGASLSNIEITGENIGSFKKVARKYNVDFALKKDSSETPPTDFYWRDIVPTDAARLTKIVTGTYNQSLKYKIIVTTNKGDTRVIADNLSTTVNNVIDCRNAALGLRSDEFITSFTLVFGTVKAGFSKVTDPQIFMTVNNGLANGYEFANKVDVGGKYNGEWVIGNSTWVTKIYAQPSKLPRTGY